MINVVQICKCVSAGQSNEGVSKLWRVQGRVRGLAHMFLQTAAIPVSKYEGLFDLYVDELSVLNMLS